MKSHQLKQERQTDRKKERKKEGKTRKVIKMRLEFCDEVYQTNPPAQNDEPQTQE